MSLSLKLLILSLAAGAMLAADKENARFAPGPAASYATRQTIDKVTIAGVPYHTPERAREAFGKLKLSEHGVLPVLVVIQNDSSQALRFDRMRVEYNTGGGSRVEATPSGDVRYIGSGRRRTNPIPNPLPTRSRKNPLDAFEIEGRAFAAKMLPPGESAHGFYYFQVAFRESAKLYISGIVQAATGKEIFYFEIPLDAN